MLQLIIVIREKYFPSEPLIDMCTSVAEINIISLQLTSSFFHRSLIKLWVQVVVAISFFFIFIDETKSLSLYFIDETKTLPTLPNNTKFHSNAQFTPQNYQSFYT